jgi:hypothetical protein
MVVGPGQDRLPDGAGHVELGTVLAGEPVLDRKGAERRFHGQAIVPRRLGRGVT